MKRKIIIAAVMAALSLCIVSCGQKEENKSQIVDGSATQAPSSEDVKNDSPESQEKTKENSSPTLAPAATAAPDAPRKAQEKIGEKGASNAVVSDEGQTREVNLAFELVNNTGIDFPALLLAPATEELLKSSNVLPENFVFENGTQINLDPAGGGAAPQLDTALFNIAAVDADGRGYVFQNIDLSVSRHITLSIDEGVPKAEVN